MGIVLTVNFDALKNIDEWKGLTLNLRVDVVQLAKKSVLIQNVPSLNVPSLNIPSLNIPSPNITSLNVPSLNIRVGHCVLFPF